MKWNGMQPFAISFHFHIKAYSNNKHHQFYESNGMEHIV